jgi:hypothetical protein
VSDKDSHKTEKVKRFCVFREKIWKNLKIQRSDKNGAFAFPIAHEATGGKRQGFSGIDPLPTTHYPLSTPHYPLPTKPRCEARCGTWPESPEGSKEKPPSLVSCQEKRMEVLGS